MPGPEGVARHLRVADAESGFDRCIETATAALLKQQRQDGHWVFELEADADLGGIYSAAALSGEFDTVLEAKIRTTCGGCKPAWGLVAVSRGPFNISASVKATALKLVGDSSDAEHMRRARSDPGSRRRRHSTSSPAYRWRCLVSSPAAVPTIPVEIIFLPRWFPFHLSRISTGAAQCWCRFWSCRR
jgi:squalene-hopene/tetraprenyl-beta-curcumene cyclase